MASFTLVARLATTAVVTGILQPAWGQQPLSGFDCLIEPNTVSEVGTGESGVLAEILVERGDLIEKGQVLARLDSKVEELAVELARVRAEAQSRLESSQLNVEYLERQLGRIEEMVARQAVSMQEQDRARTELALAKLQLQEASEEQQIAETELLRATEALARRTIRSPVNGAVMERMLAPGELVDERPIIRVAEIVPLSVLVIMPVDYYQAVDIGMKAEVVPRVPGLSTQEATVVTVDAVVDAASGTFGVALNLPNEDRAIPGGIRCDISFIR